MGKVLHPTSRPQGLHLKGLGDLGGNRFHPSQKMVPGRNMGCMESAEAAYTCPSCGESIVVPLDPSGGAYQEYVEDCPVCCHPNHLSIHLGAHGASVSARPD